DHREEARLRRGLEQARHRVLPDGPVRQVAARLRRGRQAQPRALRRPRRLRPDLPPARPARARARLLPAGPKGAPDRAQGGGGGRAAPPAHRGEAQGHDLARRRPRASRAGARRTRPGGRHDNVSLDEEERPVPTTPPQIDALKKITSPSVANAIETFKVRPREHGNLSSDIKALFPEMGPMVGHACTALIRAESGPIDGHRASTYAWWDYVLSIPAPRVIVVHDLDDPRGQGAQWGEVQANIHRALGCVGVVTDGSVRDLDEVRALGFQFCAAHVSVSHANVHMVDFGIPIKVGGVWIKPGELI